MYIYLTVSAIQIAFFIAYCSCLSKRRKLNECEKEIQAYLIYEENFQKVLEQLRKNRYNPHFYKQVKQRLDKLSDTNSEYLSDDVTDDFSDDTHQDEWSNNSSSILERY
jgi:C-terminal processing protease CtpA/Prc